MFQQLKKYLQGNSSTSPETLCPNCWGRQEYEGEFRTTLAREDITLHNIDEKKGWVDAYARKYLYGIKLQKEGNKVVCPSCQLVV